MSNQKRLRTFLVDWCSFQVARTLRGEILNDVDRNLLYAILETLNDDKLFSVISKSAKLASNSSSFGSLQREFATKRPSRPRRKRPRRKIRHRGYRDHGTLAGVDLRVLRKAFEESWIHVAAIEDLPEDYQDFLEKVGAIEEDYVDLEVVKRSTSSLEELLGTRRALELLDLFAERLEQYERRINTSE